ncbi:U3 ribonucleoprotein (Utp) family protein [Trifolium repens]|nr:U3 ribonucleoprotein (Utp) family protein [Trifolium repens]
MAEKKRKERCDANRTTGRKKSKKDTGRKKTGPHLPSSLKKEIERLNPNPIDVDEVDSDIYEYEEEQPEEESRKNKRYDPVAVNDDPNFSSDFEDENVQSDDENDDEIETIFEGITDNNRKVNVKNAVIPELYPESEYNPSRDVVEGDGRVSIEDLLNPLSEEPEFANLRKRNALIEKHARTVHAPLPTADQAKVDRKVAYEITKKEVTKWQPIIQRNREAPTLFFDEKTDLGFSTIGAIASEFEPRTEFEKKMAALVHVDKLMEAHNKDGSRLLELNKVSIEDEKDRQNRMAKMRSLLFRHEMKAKHVNKIKSRTFRRLLKKDRLKAESSQLQMDPEAAKEYALKREREMAEERMTLKHKQNSKWLQRHKQRGLDKQDEGTRAAVIEHFQRHDELTRKINTMDSSSSSSDDSSYEDDDDITADSDPDKDNKILQKAKQKTLEVLGEDDEIPKSGLLSLPFMRRGLEKRKEATIDEVNLTLHEFEDSMKKLDNSDGSEDPKVASTSGRRVFGMAKAQIIDAGSKLKLDKFYDNSDSEDELEASKSGNNENEKDVINDSVLNQEVLDNRKESVFKNFDEVVKNPGPKTTYEVSLFASNTWKKAKNTNSMDTDIKKSANFTGPVRHNVKNTENDQMGEHSDTDDEGQMVDGILTSASKPSYELPSQEELIREIFAADDVEGDFEKDKQAFLNEENPEPEKPQLLPGWGNWTNVQHKIGLPSKMVKEHENAWRKREDSLNRRRDAHHRHVIYSEKPSKKAEKLFTKTLPFPYTSPEMFDQNNRAPLGPDFNPTTTNADLIRPEMVKKPGLIIKPVEFEEVNQHGKPVQRIVKHKLKKTKGNDSLAVKKTKFKGKRSAGQ